MKYEERNNLKIQHYLNKGNSYIKKIEETIKDELNNYCVECGEGEPDYISINNGIFLCGDCAKNHLKLPKGISKIKKNNIKSLTLNEIQYLLCGGNRSLLNFIYNEYPKLAELSPNFLYRTQAMIYYRQYLQCLIDGNIPPIKPNQKLAYKIPNIFNILSNKNFNNNNNLKELVIKNEISNYNINIDNNETLYENNSKFNKTEYNFFQNKNNQKKFNKININNINANSHKYNNKIKIYNTIENETINNENHFINSFKPKKIIVKNNNNIIIKKNLKFINNFEKVRKYEKFSPQKIRINSNSNSRNKKIKPNINSQNRYKYINTEVYIKPKLFFSNNLSLKHLISDHNTIEKRTISYDKIKKPYFYYQSTNNLSESNIGTIHLKLSIDNNKKRRANIRHRIFNNSKKFKIDKYIRKSLSEKLFNSKNKSENNINNLKIKNKNNFFFISQAENNQYNPQNKKFFKNNINFIQNHISVKKIEQFEIKPKEKILNDIKNNNNSKNNNNNNNYNSNTISVINNDKFLLEDNLSIIHYNKKPIKINIKVNKKENIEKLKEKNDKEDIDDDIINKKENIYCLTQSKFEKQKTEKIKDFILKCNKNRIILREKEKKKSIINKNKENKDIEDKVDKIVDNINNENNDYDSLDLKRINFNTYSQENLINIKNKINKNINQSDKIKFSIRNRYKMITKKK